MLGRTVAGRLSDRFRGVCTEVIMVLSIQCCNSYYCGRLRRCNGDANGYGKASGGRQAGKAKATGVTGRLGKVVSVGTGEFSVRRCDRGVVSEGARRGRRGGRRQGGGVGRKRRRERGVAGKAAVRRRRWRRRRSVIVHRHVRASGLRFVLCGRA